MFDLVDEMEQFLRSELGAKGTVPLHEPWLAANEWAYVKEALDTNWVSTAGPFVDRFEARCAEMTSALKAVAVINGTCALHIALLAVGVVPGDLVICPAISFVGTANAIAHCGAEPLFTDIRGNDLTLDPEQLTTFLHEECKGSGRALIHRITGRRVAAIVPVHIFGHPADMEAINSAAAAYDLPVIEDAAEGAGSLYKGRPCGNLGLIGILSFNGNKTVTAGGGGAVITDDLYIADRVRHLTTNARIANGFELDYDMVGYNYRLPNLNAALACAQLERLDYFVELKRALAERYERIFGIRFLHEPADTRSNYWLNTIALDSKGERDEFLAETRSRGIETRPCWRPLPLLPMYKDCQQSSCGVRVAIDLWTRLVSLPSSPKLAAALLRIER